MYFKNIPKIYYDFEINGKKELKILKDITHNVRLNKELLSNIVNYYDYKLQDGDTPEILSYKFYGSVKYHWVILLANETYHWIRDFPLTESDLQEYVTNKYNGEENEIRHYVKNGYIVNSDEIGASPVSYYEHENNLNEQKRSIKIIDPEFLPKLLNEYGSIFK